MSPDQQFWIAIATQIVALVAAMGIVLAQLRGLRHDHEQLRSAVNGKMDAMLSMTSTSQYAAGVASQHPPAEPHPS